MVENICILKTFSTKLIKKWRSKFFAHIHNDFDTILKNILQNLKYSHQTVEKVQTSNVLSVVSYDVKFILKEVEFKFSDRL